MVALVSQSRVILAGERRGMEKPSFAALDRSPSRSVKAEARQECRRPPAMGWRRVVRGINISAGADEAMDGVGMSSAAHCQLKSGLRIPHLPY